jgi:hypothetical protein
MDTASSPTANEGRSTPLPKTDAETASDGGASPLPIRSRHGHSPSIGRKRPNEEIYERAEHPKTSPTASRFRRSDTIVAIADQDAHQTRGNPAERFGTAVSSQMGQTPLTATTDDGHATDDTTLLNKRTIVAPAPADNTSSTFATQMHDYQQSLEREFQDFEQRLNEQDSAGELETMDWSDFEARFREALEPHVLAEAEITDEFALRFQVAPYSALPTGTQCV